MVAFLQRGYQATSSGLDEGEKEVSVSRVVLWNRIDSGWRSCPLIWSLSWRNCGWTSGSTVASRRYAVCIILHIFSHVLYISPAIRKSYYLVPQL